MILEGKNAVATNRKIMGATNPKDAENNTIRKLYGISIDKNSVHGSDPIDNAKKEIGFFFQELIISKNFDDSFRISFLYTQVIEFFVLRFSHHHLDSNRKIF